MEFEVFENYVKYYFTYRGKRYAAFGIDQQDAARVARSCFPKLLVEQFD